MLVAGVDGAVLTPVCIERRITRTAKDFDRANRITEEAQQRNIRALIEYRDILSRFRIEAVSCGATGVLRRAGNSGKVLDRISRETGIEVRVLSEETEAFLSAKGMLSVLDKQRPSTSLFFDVGGGSTEFLLVRSGECKPVWEASMPVGAATLTGAYLSSDPPEPGSFRKAEGAVRDEIISTMKHMPPLSQNAASSASAPLQLVGTAGTVTTLAAMNLGMTEYVPYRINGAVLKRDWLCGTIADLSEMTLERRSKIPGLERGREDIILGGAVIVKEILDYFQLPEFMVTDAGLLEGLLLDLIEKGRGLPASLTTGLTWRLQKR